jgi:hypothetical protein
VQLGAGAEQAQQERDEIAADRDLDGEKESLQELVTEAGVAIGQQRPQRRL